MSEPHHPSRTKLIAAALDVVRARGWAATRLDDVCAAAGVTKGSFFHHFDGKDALGLAAAEAWAERADGLLEALDPAAIPDPYDRLLAYIDLRRAIITGDFVEWTCFAGTVVQETWATNPALAAACGRTITDHAAGVADLVADAMGARGIGPDGWSAASLALHIQGVIQGAFILAKATGRAEAAIDSLDHLRRYVTLLFRA
jgi:TetR/AcrR family transcriptional repressor of nem operon